MRILLTGKSGFLGKNIFNNLSKNYNLIAYAHKELDLLDYVKVKRCLETNKFDIIIHSAVGNGKNIVEDTIRMFVNIIANSKDVKRIVYFGSGAEYAKDRNLVKVKESEGGKYIPVDSYGFSKYVCHEITKKDRKFINLRLFGVFGPHEDYKDKFISNSIVKNLLGIPIKIKQDVVFDYLYINDLVKILEYFIKGEPQFSSYNITPTESIKLSKIVEIINNIEARSKVKLVNRGLNYEYTGDNSRLLQFIPSFKFTAYEKSIRDLYFFYKKNLSEVDVSAVLKDEYLKLSKIRSRNEKNI